MSNLDQGKVETALQLLASAELVRIKKPAGDWYSMYCPFHNNGNEKKPAFGVLLKEQYKNGQRYPVGFCHCFVCNYARSFPEMISDLLKSHNISKSGLEWLKENIDGFEVEKEFENLIPEDLMVSVNDSFAVNYIMQQLQPKSTSFVSEEELASYRFTVPYMYERHLTDEIIEQYDIGFDAKHVPPGRKKPLPCITFPVRDADGNTLFFCRRSIEGKYFNYPEGITKPVYGLYELDKSAKRVVICESCLNALNVRRFGDQAVALLGTGNSYQINQLRQLGIHEFVLGFDPDEAGKRATAKLKKALHDVAIVWSFEGIPEGKDLNDLTYETYKSLRLV